MDHAVLVVGAGPTGLMLAGWLARAGVRALVIDDKAGPSRETRALAVQARTLETYDQLGLGPEALSMGIEFSAINLWVRRHHQARMDFGALGAGISPHPYMFILGQDRNEALLLAHLQSHGGDVEWRTRFEAMREEADGVVVTLRGPEGETREVRVGYVCGCDGASSTVRHALGLAFPGGTYHHRFFVADVALTGDVRPGELNVCFDGDRFAAFFPMPGPSHFRLVGMVPDALLGQESLTFEDVRDDVESRFPAHVTSVGWFSTYRVHHRVAETFHRGRAFLLGDAGHIHSPVGGQGMNTGLMDAANLAWKLAWVVQGQADARLLDSYAAEREPFARTLVATTDRAFTAVSSSAASARFIRMQVIPRVFPLLARQAWVRRAIFRFGSQTRVNYRGGPLSVGEVGPIQAGDRLAWVRFSDGTSNYDPLRSLGPQLHVHGPVEPALQAWADKPPAVPVIAFPWTPEARAAGYQEGAVYLVRPDGYVGYAAARFEAGALSRYLGDQWGMRDR